MEKNKQQPEEQLTEYEKKYRALKMREEVKKTAERTRKQMDKEWNRYQEAKKIALQKKAEAERATDENAKEAAMKVANMKAKEANEALKMGRFFMRMHELAQRFMLMLERIQSIDELFRILEGTQEIFHSILGQKNDKVTKNMKKDLRLFKKKLASYEAQMDDLLDFIDSIFDDKPNVFVRIVRWFKGEKQKSALDTLAANEKELLPQIESYQNEQMGEATATDTGSDTPTGTEKGGDFGGFVMPND